MKTDELIIYGILILVIGVIIYSAIGMLAKDNGAKGTEENQQGVVQDQQYKAIVTGTTESGDVEIALTPQWREGKLYINMAVNTHSVDLSQFDLQEQTTLSYNNKEIKPTQAPSLSGHHSNGLLVFDVTERPKTFTLVIRGVPAVLERVFQW